MEMDNYYVYYVIIGLFAIVYFALYGIWFNREVDGAVRLKKNDMKYNWFNVAFLLVAAFIVKLLFAVNFEGHGTDMNCFKSWSEMVFNDGISQFYYHDAFTDYPPGYMLVLWCVAAVRHLFGIETGSDTGIFLIKLFPILCDLGTGCLIYIMSKKRFSEGMSIVLMAIYVLNPVIVLNSSVWGQVDGVFTLAVLATCYLCMEEKRIPAYFVFCLGALMKPQTLVFTPILIFTIIEQVFLKDFNKKKMIKDLVGGLAAIGAMFLAASPFGLEKVVRQYMDTLGSYEYCTVNAYNFWMILGKNWASQTDKFLFLECRTWGTIAIFAAVGLSAWVFFRAKEEKSKYFLSMAVVVSVMFLFSVRMHERYLFPVIVLVLAGFIMKPRKELFYTFIGFTVVQFLNVSHVYYTFVEFETTGPEGYIMGATAAATIFMFGYLLYCVFRKSEVVYEPSVETGKPSRKNRKYGRQAVKAGQNTKKERFTFTITPSNRDGGMVKKDFIILFVIMAIYSCFALYDLGYMSAPETGWEARGFDNVIALDFGETKTFSAFYAYPGSYEDRKFTLETSEDGVNYSETGVLNTGSVFRWNDVKISADDSDESEKKDFNITARYLRMTFRAIHEDEKGTLKELLFKDQDGNIILPVNAREYPALFDEQDDFDPEMTFRSGTYFDEIYHARTAYEMIHDLYCYENTHPPLGKFFISIGIRLFGMNPFGWRIIGVIFGIGMLPFMYLFSKRLFKETWVAGIVTTMFAFDFMHFTQTRISTIDVYGTFFIIAMFYFMLRYSQTSFYDTDFKKTLIPLGLSGVMMGLGCASKWTAVYAGAGLGVYFLGIMIRRYLEYRVAKKDPRGQSSGISHRHILNVYGENVRKTLMCCVVFFIVIPGLIYLASYLSFDDKSSKGLWTQMINNQTSMYSYHSQLESDHPYSSTWYEWPSMIRPVFYYSNTVQNDLQEGISAFGNPLVWWAGIFAFIYMIYRIIKKSDRVAAFLSFGYLVQYLPWVLVTRCTFAYHYFPSVPFITMMVGYSLYNFFGDTKKKRIFAFVYCGAAVALFLLFYPVLSGQPVTADYVNNGLKWLKGWVLIL